MWDMQTVTSQCKNHIKRPHKDRYIVELLPQMQVKGGQFVSFVKLFIHMYCEAKCVCVGHGQSLPVQSLVLLITLCLICAEATKVLQYSQFFGHVAEVIIHKI
jgi:hypothetical protein